MKDYVVLRAFSGAAATRFGALFTSCIVELEEVDWHGRQWVITQVTNIKYFASSIPFGKVVITDRGDFWRLFLILSLN